MNFVHYMQKSSKIWLDAPALLLDFKIWKFSFLISKRNYKIRMFRISTTCIKRLRSTNLQSIFPLWRKPFIIWPQWWHFLLRREIKNKQPQRTLIWTSLNMVYMYLSYIVLYPFKNDEKNNNTSLFTDPLFSLLRSWARIGK